MTKRPNPLLLAVLGVAVLLGAYMLLWKPRADDIASARSDRDELASELALARASTPRTTPTTNAVADTALATAIPATPDLANLLRQFKAIGAGAGVAVTAITPSPAVGLGSVAGGAVSVALTGSGSRDAVNAYVTQLSAMPRLFVIDKLTIGGSESTGSGPDATTATTTGTIELTINGRVFTTQAAASGTATATATTTAPAATPTTPATTAAHG
jgi:Tfp pilus assembly protein PilO